MPDDIHVTSSTKVGKLTKTIELWQKVERSLQNLDDKAAAKAKIKKLEKSKTKLTNILDSKISEITSLEGQLKLKSLLKDDEKHYYDNLSIDILNDLLDYDKQINVSDDDLNEKEVPFRKKILNEVAGLKYLSVVKSTIAISSISLLSQAGAFTNLASGIIALMASNPVVGVCALALGAATLREVVKKLFAPEISKLRANKHVQEKFEDYAAKHGSNYNYETSKTTLKQFTDNDSQAIKNEEKSVEEQAYDFKMNNIDPWQKIPRNENLLTDKSFQTAMLRGISRAESDLQRQQTPPPTQPKPGTSNVSFTELENRQKAAQKVVDDCERTLKTEEDKLSTLKSNLEKAEGELKETNQRIMNNENFVDGKRVDKKASERLDKLNQEKSNRNNSVISLKNQISEQEKVVKTSKENLEKAKQEAKNAKNDYNEAYQKYIADAQNDIDAYNKKYGIENLSEMIDKIEASRNKPDVEPVSEEEQEKQREVDQKFKNDNPEMSDEELTTNLNKDFDPNNFSGLTINAFDDFMEKYKKLMQYTISPKDKTKGEQILDESKNIIKDLKSKNIIKDLKGMSSGSDYVNEVFEKLMELHQECSNLEIEKIKEKFKKQGFSEEKTNEILGIQAEQG